MRRALLATVASIVLLVLPGLAIAQPPGTRSTKSVMTSSMPSPAPGIDPTEAYLLPEAIPAEEEGYFAPPLHSPFCYGWGHCCSLPSAIGRFLGFDESHVIDDRHVGRGLPLVGTSWLNRPYSASIFYGGLVGDELIEDRVELRTGDFGGFRIGWDFDHFWGTELRLAWGDVDLRDTPSTEPPRAADVFMADLNLRRYLWGDAAWRPYWSVGLGVATFDFRDEFAIQHDESLVSMPIGMGIKYQFQPWWGLRAEVMDNIAFAGGDLDAMHNVSLTLGAEVRFGARPRSYWPWNPSRHIW
jgi:hypothetical protein